MTAWEQREFYVRVLMLFVACLLRSEVPSERENIIRILSSHIIKLILFIIWILMEHPAQRHLSFQSVLKAPQTVDTSADVDRYCNKKKTFELT